MKATFENTVQKLVTAFLKDELVHGQCHGCAVGTICGNPYWGRHFITLRNKRGELSRHLYAGDNEIIVKSGDKFILVNRDVVSQKYIDQWEEGLAYIEKSGYTKKQLADIEHAFEIAPKGKDNDEWMFNGLMAVVDVLAEIHGISLESKESAKALFVKV